MDELNKIYVSPEVTPEEMVASIITGKGTITFPNEDLPPGGLAHNNALYFTVTCLHKNVPITLIDHGSNVKACL